MTTCGAHSNTCDPLYVEHFFLAVTRSGGYKKYTDEALKEIMLQMDIAPFVYVRAMRELLSKKLSNRKTIDNHMIVNVRFRACKIN